MQIHCSFNKQDHINFLMFYAAKSKNYIKNRLIVLAAILFFLLALFIIHKSYIFPVIALIYLITFIPYTKWLYRRSFKKATDTRFKNNICWEGILSIENDEFLMVAQKSKIAWKYSIVKTIYETEKYYFIGSEDEAYMIIPKSSIETALLKEFISELESKTHLSAIYVKKSLFS